MKAKSEFTQRAKHTNEQTTEEQRLNNKETYKHIKSMHAQITTKQSKNLMNPRTLYIVGKNKNKKQKNKVKERKK